VKDCGFNSPIMLENYKIDLMESEGSVWEVENYKIDFMNLKGIGGEVVYSILRLETY